VLLLTRNQHCNCTNLYFRIAYFAWNCMHTALVDVQMVASSLAPTCKCHGVSGSCSIKTCWKALPDVRQFGLALQKRYATAMQIRARRDRRSRERRLVAVQRSRRSVAEDELVYYTISPDYCLPDNSLGSVGTRGRYRIEKLYNTIV